MHQHRGRQGLDLLEKIPWRRECLPTQVFSPGEFHGQKSLAGYSPWGLKELDTAEQLTLSGCRFVSYKGKFSLSFPDVPFKKNSFKHMVFFFFFRIHSTDEHIFFFNIINSSNSELKCHQRTTFSKWMHLLRKEKD